MMTSPTPFNFNGKVALVTGGTRGIGKKLTTTLAQHGAIVYFCGTNQELGETVANEINQNLVPGCTETSFLKVDVSNFTACRDMIAEITAETRQIDFLINNAGITRDNLLMRMKEDEWDAVITVNLKGTFNCIKAVTRTMMKQRAGKIVNVSSVVGVMGNAGQANYAASKAGVIGLTKSVAKEFGSRNIQVNAVAPGYIQTDMTKDLPEEAKSQFMTIIPLKRPGTAEDVAKAVLFLSSDLSDYITGQVLHVDGGMVM